MSKLRSLLKAALEAARSESEALETDARHIADARHRMNATRVIGYGIRDMLRELDALEEPWRGPPSILDSYTIGRREGR